jgi:hypothetical protein
LEKSSIFFGLRCGDQVKEDVMQRLGVNNESLQDTYLGSFTLLAPIPEGAAVDFLLQDDHGAWDVDVVRAVFEEDVANQVLQIPINRRVGEDFMSWPHTKFGDYTVRSAYNLARSEKFFLDRSMQGGGASSITENFFQATRPTGDRFSLSGDNEKQQ